MASPSSASQQGWSAQELCLVTFASHSPHSLWMLIHAFGFHSSKSISLTQALLNLRPFKFFGSKDFLRLSAFRFKTEKISDNTE